MLFLYSALSYAVTLITTEHIVYIRVLAYDV